MAVTVAAVMRHIRNFFQGEPVEGEYSITGNVLAPAPAAPWVYISGSNYHDGAYQLIDGVLQGVSLDAEDEDFDGIVWPLRPPPDFLALCDEIAAYDQKNPAGALQSESFGSYTYNRGASQNGRYDWQTVYAPMLSAYRRMFPGVG